MLEKDSIFHNYYYGKELLLLGLILIGIGLRPLMMIGTFIIGLVLFFFRNNLALRKYKKGTIISPSSSEVISIKKEGRKNKITTYLSPLDRHYMIAPVDCRVKRIDKRLQKGDEERVTVFFEDVNGNEFSLSQIVKKIFKGPGVLGSYVFKWLYDNRIVYFCKEGDKLKRGERWGLIRFGSSMEYRLPTSYKMEIEVGKKYSLGNIIGDMSKKANNETKEEWDSDLFEGITPGYLMLGLLAPAIVFFYGWYRCKNIATHKDILEFSLFKESNKYGVDGWLLSHYLFFTLIGFVYPDTMRLSVLAGIMWELFEWYCGVYKPKCLEGFGFCASPSGSKKNEKVWWYWKWQDPIANLLGFMTGKYLKTGRVML
jgi:phosphatidylserine decarboxylase